MTCNAHHCGDVLCFGQIPRMRLARQKARQKVLLARQKVLFNGLEYVLQNVELFLGTLFWSILSAALWGIPLSPNSYQNWRIFFQFIKKKNELFQLGMQQWFYIDLVCISLIITEAMQFSLIYHSFFGEFMPDKIIDMDSKWHIEVAELPIFS